MNGECPNNGHNRKPEKIIPKVMIKRVMIRLCGYLSGVSVCALHILFCSRLFGWVATLVIVGVQLGIAGWIVYMRIRAPD